MNAEATRIIEELEDRNLIEALRNDPDLQIVDTNRKREIEALERIASALSTHGSSPKPIPTAEATSLWYRHIRDSDIKANTRKGYLYVARLIETSFPDSLPTTADEIDRMLNRVDRARALKLKLDKGKGLSPNTRRAYVKWINVMYRFLRKQGIANEIADMPLPKKERSQVGVLTPAQMDQVVKAPLQEDWGPCASRDYAYLRLLRNTGLRPGDALNLRQEGITIDEDKGVAYLEFGETKTGGAESFCDSETARLLRQLGGDWVFRNSREGTLLSYDGGLVVIKKALKRVGLDRKGLAGHLFRRGFVTEGVDLGTDLETLRQLLNHSNIAQTIEYAHLARGQIGEKYRNLLQGRQGQERLVNITGG